MRHSSRSVGVLYHSSSLVSGCSWCMTADHTFNQVTNYCDAICLSKKQFGFEIACAEQLPWIEMERFGAHLGLIIRCSWKFMQAIPLFDTSKIHLWWWTLSDISVFWGVPINILLVLYSASYSFAFMCRLLTPVCVCLVEAPRLVRLVNSVWCKK